MDEPESAAEKSAALFLSRGGSFRRCRKLPLQTQQKQKGNKYKSTALSGPLHKIIVGYTESGGQPDINILDARLLAEVRGLKHKNVAAKLLEKLLKDELKVRSKHRTVQIRWQADAQLPPLQWPPDPCHIHQMN